MEYLTHKEVQSLIHRVFTDLGWQKLKKFKFRLRQPKDKGEGFTLAEQSDGTYRLEKTTAYLDPDTWRHGNLGMIRPDAVYVHPEKSGMVVLEIKPENAKLRELLTGVGQALLLFNLENVRPYLVMPKGWYEVLVFTLELTPIGVITYDNKLVEIMKKPTVIPDNIPYKHE